MNPELSAVLARYADGPEARRELRRRRRAQLSQAERLEAAESLSASGAHRAAALWLAAASRDAPEDARVAYRLGNALRMAGKSQAAARVLNAVCRRHPAWGEPAQSLAWLKRRAGDAEGAADTLERWFAAVGPQTKVLRAVSAFLDEMGMTARAENLLAAAPESDADLWAERGNLLLKLGRFDEAETVLRKAVTAKPEQAGAWLRLAQVKRWQNAEASPLALMDAGLRRVGLDVSVHATIAFAISKVRDDLGDYAAAWASLERANTLRAESAHFDRAAWRDFEQALYAVFTPEFFARFLRPNNQREAPVFIVGMPRSGTTLVERRLGRHSTFFPAGELELIEALGIEVAGNRGYPAGLDELTPEVCAAAARLWRERLPAALPRTKTVIDKNPLNFLHLGWIACLFPGAHIIHCRRDPLDTALSLWFQNFAHPKNDYAYRVEDIAWMIALYRRVMAHWERVLPRPVYALDYERLVTEPEAELRALVEGLGSAWEPAILDDAVVGDDTIATASVWQARQPIYARSVGRARHYEPWIAPFTDALANEGVSEKA